MKVTWTNEQQKVIDLRKRNILVSAAAGSGKTAVLVERIITMLTDETDPMDVDQLLVVTFTEAAASEMKERIRNAIEKKLEENPGNEHLMRQAMLIHSAQITTIHSFCLSVIRDHFHAIDLDPGFRVGEEGELKLLRHDVLGELLEERYLSGTERFLNLTSAYGGRNNKKLEEVILKIYDFSRSYPDAAGWLDNCLSAYSMEDEQQLEESAFIGMMKENVHKLLADICLMIQEAVGICLEADGPYVYEDTLLKDLEIVENLCNLRTYQELDDALHSVKWSRIAINKDKTVSEEKVKLVKDIREDYKSLVKDLIGQYFYQEQDEMIKDLKVCRPYMEELISLVTDFGVRFEEKKRSQNMIDFSDMEQYALRILTKREEGNIMPSEIAKDYQEQFAEIMIDEYQDSNLIQEAILTSVSGLGSGNYNIFMVGDVKQSIYRFRLSRPELFMEKYYTYSLEDGQKQRIDLHKNFRSRREVLDSVNYIFRQIMTKNLGGIEYDEKVALHAGASFEDAYDKETEILVIETEKAGKAKERELEAKVIASRIHKLMKHHKVQDKKTGEMRSLAYSDIVILVRSISGFVEHFMKCLNDEGIPTHVGTREGYFTAQEVGVILSYLQVLNNWKQDIPLAAVLTSSIGNMTEKELAIIRSQEKELPFYEAVFRYREIGEDEDIRRKLCHFISQLEAFRKIVPYTPIKELLSKILYETGFMDYVSAMPGGEQRKANLEMLIEKARVFESTSYKGLFHFVRYIEQLKKYNVDYGEANIEDEQSQSVRIMTIHKSKGLEFPVVFVAGIGKGFNMQDAKSAVALHARLGVGLDAVDVKIRTRCPSIVKKIIQREEVLDTLGEELRILYVAFTRAKEKLIITGTLTNMEEKLLTYSLVEKQKRESLSFARLSKVATYWDWILPALIRMTDEIPIKMICVSPEDVINDSLSRDMEKRLEKTVLDNWNVQRVYSQEMKTLVEEQFAYEYPYQELQLQKQKYSVSELKKQVYEEEISEQGGEPLYKDEEVVPLIPKFLQEEEEVKGALRGTAYHRLLELLDFAQNYSYEMLKQKIEEFCENGRMEKELAKSIRIKDILGFLESPIGQRMRNSAKAGKLKKEQPFVLGVDQGGEMILVQGIIDVYFEEDDELVVLDYKTDRVSKVQELVDKYHAQLEYYAKALEQLTQKKVKEKKIYSFAFGQEISV